MAALNVANFAEQAVRMVLDARQQATEILDRAREKADQVLAEAKTAAEQLRQQAQDQGLAAGKQEGYSKGLSQGQADGAEKAFNDAMALFNKQTEDLRKLLSESIRRLDESREEVLRQARADLLELALTIAERVTARGPAAISKPPRPISARRSRWSRAVHKSRCGCAPPSSTSSANTPNRSWKNWA